MTDVPPPPSSSPSASAATPAAAWVIPAGIVALAFVIMAAWTWRGWPDPLVDFGRELYVAWRVADGDRLYRDVAYFNGPLSPHVNALLFRAFGLGLMTLAWANLLVAAGIVALACWLAWSSTGDRRAPLATAAAGVTACTLFAFAQYVDVGNYNYVTPYSHEMTHGLLLGLAAIACALRAATGAGAARRNGNAAWGWAGGAALGLAFLTKIELFPAAAAGVATTLPAMLRRPGGGRAALGVVVMALLIPIFAWALLATAGGLTAAVALRGTLGGWWYAFDPALRDSPFYRRIAGTDDVAGNLASILLTAAAYAAGAAVVVGIDRVISARRSLRTPATIAAAVAVVAIAWLFFERIAWDALFAAAPVALAWLLGASIVHIRREGPSPAALARVAFVAFALVLLAKVILRPVIWQYGFVLAMPAVVAMVVAAVAWVPAWVARRDARAGGVTRAAAVAAVAVVIVVHLGVYKRLYADKPVTVAAGADAFRARGPRGAAVATMLRAVEAVVPPGATLAAVPEGAMLNYLARRRNPTPFITLLPPEFAMFGGDAILAAYRQAPPDFIVLAPRDLAEYGSAGFKADYARDLAAWIDANYDPVATDPPPQHPMRLLRKRGDVTTGDR